MNNRDQNFFDDGIDDFRSDNRSRAVGTHSTRIGAGITIVGRFVVLCRFQWNDRIPVNKREQTRFFPFEPVFDHHA